MTDALLSDAAVRAGLATSANDLRLSGNTLSNTTNGRRYFAKADSNVSQILGEAEGLSRMQKASPGICPELYMAEKVKDGNGLDKAVFISDYVDLGSSSTQSLRHLAEKMADELHNPENHQAVKMYGFPVPTHCGVTEQDNSWESDWMVFYRDRRIGDLLKQIESKRGSSSASLLTLGKEVLDKVIPKLLTSFEPPPQPVLVHGDLWSGNVATDSQTGRPVIFDCSAYYGHHEADFGISQMFGPFNKTNFYDTYYALRPPSQPYHEERLQLYELYHHLNHFLMFGAGYASGATRIMKQLLEWAEKT